MNLNENQIIIKSFSYKEEVVRTKTKIYKKLKGLTIEETHEDEEELVEVTNTHAIIYLIDQNRYWYYNYVGDCIIEKHHTKNGLYQSIKIIDDMKDRFLRLSPLLELETYSIFSDSANMDLLNSIEEYTNIEGR